MRISPEPPRVAQAPSRPLYSDLTATAAMPSADLTQLSGRRERNCQDSSWQAGDRRSAHFNLARRSAHAAFWDGYPRRKPGNGEFGENLGLFVTGCELDDVLAQAGGNIGRRTGLQRARSSHRCFGTCALHGARARDVHGLPCRMSDVARIMRATCQSLDGVASAQAERLPRPEIPGGAP
jgi:hypothetical protein